MKENIGRSFFMEVKMRNAKAVFLTAVLLLGLIAVMGCRGGRNNNMVDAREVEQSITFAGYPMNAKDKTITWFGNQGYRPNQTYTSADESPFHIYLQEMLGVNIKWQFPLAGTAGTTNLVLAENKRPMIIFGEGLMNQTELLIEEGTIYDLTPYLAEWSPAYWKLLQENPTYDRAMKTDSGKYYGYGFFREDGEWNTANTGPVINKTWLDELGLPVPATISDWDRTLRAFKENYGVALSFAWGRASGVGISGAFGAYRFADYGYYVDENRKVQIADIQPEVKKEWEQLAIWWRDGLIDQDVLSINDSMARSNALNKKMGLSITSISQLSSWVQDSRSSGNGAEWVGIQYPTGDDGTLVNVAGDFGIGPYIAVISTDTSPKDLELVMRALDYGYTEEGHLYWNFGKRGVSWDYDSNGNPAFLPLVTEDPNGLSGAVDKYSGATWDGNAVQATALIHMRYGPEAVAANDLWYYPNMEIISSNKLPNLAFTSDEVIRVGELGSTISTFVNESAIKFITGQASLDTWDDYVARVNSLGADELLGIYQAAYDRYMAR